MSRALLPFILFACMSSLPEIPLIEQHRMYLPILSYLVLLIIPSILWFPYGLSIYRKTIIVAILLCLFQINIDLILLINRSLFFPQSYSETKQNVCRHLRDFFTFPNNFYNLPDEPTILVSNYVRDRFENIFCLLIPRDIVILATHKFLSVTHIDEIIETLPTFEGKSFEYLEPQVVDTLTRRHKDVFCYIERPVFLEDTNYGDIRSGMFHIARRNGLTITPIYFDPIEHFSGMIPSQSIHIIVGPTLRLQQEEEVEKSMERVKSFFAECRNR